MIDQNTSYVVCKRDLKSFYGPISNILTLTHEDFDKIDGYLNDEDQNLLLQISHKFKNKMRNYLKSRGFGVDSVVFQNYCLIQLQRKQHEVGLIFFLDHERKLIADEVVAIGTYNQLILTNEGILKRALKHKSSQIIVVHNHPRGSVTPSKKDICFTNGLKKSCEALDINFLASLIVGGEYLIGIQFSKDK